MTPHINYNYIKCVINLQTTLCYTLDIIKIISKLANHKRFGYTGWNLVSYLRNNKFELI